MEPDASDAKSSQYVALSRGFGLVDLAGWSSVTLTGADRQKFLNNFSTNDVGRLAPGDSCESFFCNVKGRIVGHGLITCRASELVIIGPPRQGSELAAHLNRYIIREDVAVWDSTSDRRYLLAAGGPAARSAISVTKMQPNAHARNGRSGGYFENSQNCTLTMLEYGYALP